MKERTYLQRHSNVRKGIPSSCIATIVASLTTNGQAAVLGHQGRHLALCRPIPRGCRSGRPNTLLV